MAEPTTPGKKTGFAHKLYTGEVSYDFVGHRKTWYTFSAVLFAVSVLALLIFRLNLGIEFRGGAEFTAPTHVTSETVPTVRSAITDLGLKDMDALSVQTGSDDVRVQTRSLSVDEVSKVRTAIAQKVGAHEDKVDYSLIGASWGKEITQQGVIGLVVFLVLVMALIWAYFRESKMSVAAIIALLHDLVITVGLYALTRFTVTPATLIGILTILGYSLYDTVVVFDKVRENTRDIERSNHTYSEQANKGLNQVLVRSLNTTLIGVLPVAALLVAGIFILGTGPLKDLGLALFIGMVVGAYSSIFIATPLLTQLKEAEPAMKAHRERLAKRSTRVSRRTSAEPSDDNDVLVTAEEPTTGKTVAALADAGTRTQTRRQSRAARKK